MPKLQEKLINVIDQDTDPIMTEFLRFTSKMDTDYWKYDPSSLNVVPRDLILYQIESSKFESIDLRMAHSIKPITLRLMVSENRRDSSYDPNRCKIDMEMQENIWLYLMAKNRGDFSKNATLYQILKSKLPKNSDKIWSMVTDRHLFYSSLIHELSHWYRDATGNGFLQKTMLKLTGATSQEINSSLDTHTHQKHARVFSWYEVDAQCQAINAVKRLMNTKSPDRWDTLSFTDLFKIFHHNLQWYITKYSKTDPDVVRDWVIRLWKRCYREPGLLGKNMMELNIEDVMSNNNSLYLEIYSPRDYHEGWDKPRQRWWDETTHVVE
jgi:hypothetical protein